MIDFAGKSFGVPTLFDPEESHLVRGPLGDGPGWWAGAPSAHFDAISGQFYLVYRLRQPRDQGRGVECRIAVSDNGIAFTDIWALPKASLGALSIERASLIRTEDGIWRLYLGYVDPIDRRWRISTLHAPEPDAFSVSTLQPLLTADSIGCEGVKDPNLFHIGAAYYMLCSYAAYVGESPADLPAADLHASGDAYNTGKIQSRTGAAISGDGIRFHWLGDISPTAYCGPGATVHGGQEWDDYCRRISTLLPLEAGGYLALYDGACTVAENYEERTGLATSFDLKTFYSLSPDGPALQSPYASRSLRYVDVLPVGRELFYYFEMARTDGAHELRVSVVERP